MVGRGESGLEAEMVRWVGIFSSLRFVARVVGRGHEPVTRALCKRSTKLEGTRTCSRAGT